MRSKAPVKERVKEFLFEELKEPEKPIIAPGSLSPYIPLSPCQ